MKVRRIAPNKYEVYETNLAGVKRVIATFPSRQKALDYVEQKIGALKI